MISDKCIEINKHIEHTCSICLDTVNFDKNYSITECGHVFHLNCISQYSLQSSVFSGNLEKNKNFDCPNCRNEFSSIYKKRKFDNLNDLFHFLSKEKNLTNEFILEQFNNSDNTVLVKN